MCRWSKHTKGKLFFLTKILQIRTKLINMSEMQVSSCLQNPAYTRWVINKLWASESLAVSLTSCSIDSIGMRTSKIYMTYMHLTLMTACTNQIMVSNMAALLLSNPNGIYFSFQKKSTSMLMPETVPLSCSLITTFNL